MSAVLDRLLPPAARTPGPAPAPTSATAGPPAGPAPRPSAPPGPPAPAAARPEAADEALAQLLGLARRARSAADAAALRFIAVNETHALAPYRQAALWWPGQGVVALSGVATPEANAPYVQWLDQVARALHARWLGAAEPPPQAAHTLHPGLLPEPVAVGWRDWLPPQVLLVPLPPLDGGAGLRGRGLLLLARDQPWAEAEAALLDEWAALWGQAARLQATGRPLWRRALAAWRGRVPLRRALWLAALAAAGAALMLPVKLSVLAPAELVPLDPAIVRAPLDGVVGKVLVQPNQRVKAGEPLFEFDRASLESKLELARRALGTVQAEYRLKAQRALFDPEAKAQLAVLQGQMAEKQSEVSYLGMLNGRGTVPAPRDGLALFGDATEWIGKPVVTGERVMVIADEQAVELEAWLSPADAVPLAAGAPVTLFLNTDPRQPVRAKLRYLAHEAIERPDGQPAYRVRATLEPGSTLPRIGLKGTARLEADTVPAGYWMLRRPLAALRAWAGR